MTTETLRVIEAKAPTRIDLAGGTVDIWPLYLFLNRPVTLNLGIDLFAEAKIEEFRETSPRVILSSGDQGAELSMTWDELQAGKSTVPPSLILLYKLLRHFLPKRIEAGHHDPNLSLKLTTVARSPAGAGLGGSSALSVALIGAIQYWAKSPSDSTSSPTLLMDPLKEGERWIDIIRDIETTVIEVPAGLQDYYGAMFGGLQSLRWKAGSHERHWLPETILEELEKRILLFYSGQSRNSGINNWALFKSFIDKQSQVKERFQKISDATNELEEALKAHDWPAAALAIGKEWDTRRSLAEGISTPEMNEAFRIAQSLGAPAGKVCGAGGGGCFFVFVPSGASDIKTNILAEIGALPGIRPLPFKASPRGLEVQVRREY